MYFHFNVKNRESFLHSQGVTQKLSNSYALNVSYMERSFVVAFADQFKPSLRYK